MQSIWNDMVIPGIPIIEKAIRPIIIYFFLLIAIRLAGKRSIGQLTPFDLVVLLILSNTVQNAIIGSDNSVTGGLVGAVALLATNYLVVRTAYAHPKLHHMVEGDPLLLIDKGQVVLENLNREMIDECELRAVCHAHGYDEPSEVEKAILESGGSISIFPRRPTYEESIHAEMLARLDSIEALLQAVAAKSA